MGSSRFDRAAGIHPVVILSPDEIGVKNLNSVNGRVGPPASVKRFAETSAPPFSYPGLADLNWRDLSAAGGYASRDTKYEQLA